MQLAARLSTQGELPDCKDWPWGTPARQATYCSTVESSTINPNIRAFIKVKITDTLRWMENIHNYLLTENPSSF